MISPQEHADFRDHVLRSFPQEACGVLVEDGYKPCVNASSSPNTHFTIRAEELIQIEVEHGPIQAVLHSHTILPGDRPKYPANWPSGMDMQQWLRGSVRWGITATDGENLDELVWLDEGQIAPILGRPFVHGVWDCYATVRDWFRLEKGLTMRNYPRGMEWWERGQDLYSQNFASEGFVEVPRAGLKAGDVCLMQYKSPVINHAAVITGPNEILHHLFHRPSRKDRFDQWERLCVKFVRYQGTPDA